MATDLTKVNDHPVAILRKRAQERADLLSLGSVQAAFEHAAATLTQHEDEHGVVFAALDKETLARVVRGYEDVISGEPEGDFLDAVRDLLGLEA